MDGNPGLQVYSEGSFQPLALSSQAILFVNPVFGHSPKIGSVEAGASYRLSGGSRIPGQEAEL